MYMRICTGYVPVSITKFNGMHAGTHRRQNYEDQKPGPTHKQVEAIVTDAKLRTITVHKNSLAIKFFYENLSFN